MMCHQIRCPGDTDWEEICCVVPWLEKMPVCEQDLDGDQHAPPRCFKTHRPPSQLPDQHGTAKFIFTIRNPVKTLISQFKFTYSKGGTKSTDINDWVATLPNSERNCGRTMAEGFAEFWLCRSAPTVLLLCFEDMQADLPGAKPDRHSGRMSTMSTMSTMSITWPLQVQWRKWQHIWRWSSQRQT